MKKYLLLTALLITLVFSSWAAITEPGIYIELIPANNPDIGTSLDNTPTLSFTHKQYSWDAGVLIWSHFSELRTPSMYELYLSTTAEFTPTTTKKYDVPPGPVTLITKAMIGMDALEYDTEYYWQVRLDIKQSYLLAVDLQDSPVASFRTPKPSVLPYIKWTENEAGFRGGYTIAWKEANDLTAAEYSLTIPAPILPTDPDANTFTKLNEILKYNTTYEITITKLGGNGATFTLPLYTTKPLVVLGEKYRYEASPSDWVDLPQYHPVATGDDITYYMLTDEFEDFVTPGYVTSKVELSYLSPTPYEGIKNKFFMDYLLPDDADDSSFVFSARKVVLKKEITFDAAPVPGPDDDTIYITNNDLVTIQYQNGFAQIVIPDISAGTIDSSHGPNGILVVSQVATPTPVTNFYESIPVNTYWDISFATGPAPADIADEGASRKLIVENLQDPTQKLEFLLYADGSGAYSQSVDIQDLNELLYGEGYSSSLAYPPALLHIYIDEEPITVERNILWMAGGFPVSNIASAVVLNRNNLTPANEYAVNEPIGFTTPGATPAYVRVISSSDPVGMVVLIGSAAAYNVYLGDKTDPVDRTIKFKYDTANVDNNWVRFVAFDYSTDPYLALANIKAQSYNPWYLSEPANNTGAGSIAPRFAWTEAVSGVLDGNTSYRFSISLSPTPFVTGTYPVGSGDNPSNINDITKVYYTDIQDTEWYPPIDLLYSETGSPTTYFWRVVMVPTSATNATPTNLGFNNYWTYQTELEPPAGGDGTIITNDIVADRQFTAGA
ncbi:MAG: hypothetical protein FWG20_05675, partial [Candidatus Cloacimonetes bacterium]|nr:hypothetical protein [Candidatus Cloacimonadota bacterium]